MNSTVGPDGRKSFCRLHLLLWLCLGAVIFSTPAPAARVPDHLDVIVTASGTFSNVTVVSLTETHVTIRGADGSVATLKRSDLDNLTQARLRGEIVPTPGPQTNTAMATETRSLFGTNTNGTNNAAMPESVERVRARVQELFKDFSPAKVGLALILGFLGVFLAIYLFSCYCLMLICKKTGNEPGFLIWLPILKVFPLLRAASMSYGWALAYFAPQLGVAALKPILPPAALLAAVIGLLVLSIATYILWCVKITQARGKHWVIAILLLLPVLSLFAFLYLAFSKGVEEEDGRPPTVAPLPT